MAAGANTFEGGSDGTTISVANSGGGSGDACSAVTVGLNCTLDYDSAQARNTLSAHFLMDATAASTRLTWTEALGTADCWYSIEYRKTAHPASTWFYLLRINNDDTGDPPAAGVAILSNGKIRFDDTTGTSVPALAGTSIIPNDQWVRVELRLDVTAGEAEWWYYADPDSDTATETLSTTGVNLGANQLHQLMTGNISVPTNMNGREWWVDNVRWSNEAKLGPVIATQTLLPDADTATGNWAALGAASLWQATSDASDSTYMFGTAS